MRRWSRLAVLALGVTLAMPAAPRPAFAQEEQPAEEGEKGRPWDGYIATGMFVGLALFLIGKSARR